MKTLFNLAARSSIQHDPELKLYFDNRMAKGANGMSTINIVRNKLIQSFCRCKKRNSLCDNG
jgi:transposase